MFEPYVEKPLPFWQNQKIWIGVGVIVFALIVAIGFYMYSTRVVAHEFAGGLVSVKGSVITVDGSFISEDHPEAGKDEVKANISLDTSIKILKTIIYLPTQEELKASKGVFDGRSLKRETISVTYDEMLKDLSSAHSHVNIFAKSSQNIYKKAQFAVIEIKYEIAQ